ncbi:stalk domain-containing protein [Paenibacillus oleatilyticus]|uniref:Stalk domain-containing protein n=1 Tax=Paenibacillus oleatilyticus TaxID=2594886 RepID=A0ABV4UX57_9BACL
MKKLIAGIVIGSALTMTATAGAAAVKQYILTEAPYPIVVNGKEYKDAAAPILNYEGSTYVPLAKLGDITGVNYKWNDAAKRVEIVTGTTSGSETTQVKDLHPESAAGTKGTPSGNVSLSPDAKTVEPKGLVEENGKKVFYAYDKDDKYKGRFTDEDDGSLVVARIHNKPAPPALSEGWLGAGKLSDIYGDTGYDGNDYVIKTNPFVAKQEIFFRFPLPDGWKDQENGETTSDGVRIKKFQKGLYFNIADLQKAGVLK